MRKILFGIAAFFALSIAAIAQPYGPGPTIPPCTAFGTTAGTCIQGAGALGTPTSGNGTNITNVNAATLGGSAIGTSGATVPLLNGANTWSGKNTLGGVALDPSCTTTGPSICVNSNAIALVGGTSGFVFYNQAFNTTEMSLSNAGALVTAGSLTIGTVASSTGLFVCETAGLISSGITTCVASDKRVKNDLGIVTPEMAVARVMALPDEHRFTYKPGYGPSGDHTGWWAQDIAKSWPGIVYRGKPTKLTPDGELSMDRAEIGPDTTTAVKWLISEVRKQKAEISRLERRH